MAAHPAEALAAPTAPGVCVFDRHPDLVGDVEPAVDAVLRRMAFPTVVLGRGSAEAQAVDELGGAGFGVLVVDGLLTRSIEVDGRRGTELLGPGDVFRHDEDGLDGVPARRAAAALTRVTLALLDDRCAAIATRCPELLPRLLARSMDRARTQTLLRALAGHRFARTRLWLLLWHLADRWGRVLPEGVHLPYALTHRTLGDLVSVRRPTVTSSIAELGRDGLLERRADGSWLLTGPPPAAA